MSLMLYILGPNIDLIRYAGNWCNSYNLDFKSTMPLWGYEQHKTPFSANKILKSLLENKTLDNFIMYLTNLGLVGNGLQLPELFLNKEMANNIATKRKNHFISRKYSREVKSMPAIYTLMADVKIKENKVYTNNNFLSSNLFCSNNLIKNNRAAYKAKLFNIELLEMDFGAYKYDIKQIKKELEKQLKIQQKNNNSQKNLLAQKKNDETKTSNNQDKILNNYARKESELKNSDTRNIDKKNVDFELLATIESFKKLELFISNSLKEKLVDQKILIMQEDELKLDECKIDGKIDKTPQLNCKPEYI